MADVEQTGELVRDCLALHGLVQVGVLDRHRGLAHEVGEQLALGVREVGTLAHDRDHAHVVDVAAGAQASAQRAGERVHVVERDRQRAVLLDRCVAAGRLQVGQQVGDVLVADLEGVALGGSHGVGQALGRAAHLHRCIRRASIGTARPASASHASTAVRTASSSSPCAVEPGRERVAHAADGLLQLAALALDLLDLRRQLARHLVELLAERGELVVALRGHRLAEVALGQAARRTKELVDLTLSARTMNTDSTSASDKEAEQDHADQHAALADGGRDAARLGEDANRHGRPDRLLQLLECCRDSSCRRSRPCPTWAAPAGPSRRAWTQAARSPVNTRTSRSVRPLTDSANALGSGHGHRQRAEARRRLGGGRRHRGAAIVGPWPPAPRASAAVVERRCSSPAA